jgi:hypothetical protein
MGQHHLLLSLPDGSVDRTLTLCDRRVKAVRSQGDSAGPQRPTSLSRRNLCDECKDLARLDRAWAER